MSTFLRPSRDLLAAFQRIFVDELNTLEGDELVQAFLALPRKRSARLRAVGDAPQATPFGPASADARATSLALDGCMRKSVACVQRRSESMKCDYDRGHDLAAQPAPEGRTS